MSVITQVRDYIKVCVREIDSQYKENNFVHTPDTVGAMKFDKSYFVRFLPMAISRQSTSRFLTINTQIEINAKAGADMIAAHDKILCDSINLSVKLTNRERMNGIFAGVTTSSIEPEQVDSNERWTKVTINAEFEVYI